MVQRDGVSCGVFQCLLMERLALSVEDWWKGAVSTEAINKQRSKTARRIMNIQGACAPWISDTGSNGSDDVHMDHNGHIEKDFERQVMSIDDEIPSHEIPLWKNSQKPPGLKPKPKTDSPDTDNIASSKEPSMAGKEKTVTSPAHVPLTPSAAHQETDKNEAVEDSSGTDTKNITLEQDVKTKKEDPRNAGVPLSPQEVAQSPDNANEEKKERVSSANDPESVTQSPIEDKDDKKKTVPTQQAPNADAWSPASLDMLNEAGKTAINAKALKVSKVPQSKEDRMPEHLKKKCSIAIAGKETLVSEMDLQKTEQAHEMLNKIVNPSPQSSEKRAGKPRLEKELKEITDRSNEFRTAVKRVMDKKWHFEEHKRHASEIKTKCDKVITNNCRARLEKQRQEAESTEDERSDDESEEDESKKKEAELKKKDELKKKEAELKKKVEDACWSHQHSTWSGCSRDEKKRQKHHQRTWRNGTSRGAPHW